MSAALLAHMNFFFILEILKQFLSFAKQEPKELELWSLEQAKLCPKPMIVKFTKLEEKSNTAQTVFCCFLFCNYKVKVWECPVGAMIK